MLNRAAVAVVLAFVFAAACSEQESPGAPSALIPEGAPAAAAPVVHGARSVASAADARGGQPRVHNATMGYATVEVDVSARDGGGEVENAGCPYPICDRSSCMIEAWGPATDWYWEGWERWQRPDDISMIIGEEAAAAAAVARGGQPRVRNATIGYGTLSVSMRGYPNGLAVTWWGVPLDTDRVRLSYFEGARQEAFLYVSHCYRFPGGQSSSLSWLPNGVEFQVQVDALGPDGVVLASGRAAGMPRAAADWPPAPVPVPPRPAIELSVSGLDRALWVSWSPFSDSSHTQILIDAFAPDHSRRYYVDRSTTDFLADRLRNGVTYTVVVHTLGTGATAVASAEGTPTPTIDLPVEIYDVYVYSNSGDVLVRWTRKGGGGLAYEHAQRVGVRVRVFAGAGQAAVYDETFGASTRGVTIPGLAPGVVHQVQVDALGPDALGLGGVVLGSDRAEVLIPVPEVEISYVFVHQRGYVLVRWGWLQRARARVRVFAGAGQAAVYDETLGASTREVRIPGLAPGVVHQVQVDALGPGGVVLGSDRAPVPEIPVPEIEIYYVHVYSNSGDVLVRWQWRAGYWMAIERAFHVRVRVFAGAGQAAVYDETLGASTREVRIPGLAPGVVHQVQVDALGRDGVVLASDRAEVLPRE